jgi:hypothetical protein
MVINSKQFQNAKLQLHCREELSIGRVTGHDRGFILQNKMHEI